MPDSEVLSRINELVEEEHRLRTEVKGAPEGDPRHRRLHEVEVSLDQCWDLLRQRRARREFGENPDDAKTRPGDVVEKYVQ